MQLLHWQWVHNGSTWLCCDVTSWWVTSSWHWLLAALILYWKSLIAIIILCQSTVSTGAWSFRSRRSSVWGLLHPWSWLVIVNRIMCITWSRPYHLFCLAPLRGQNYCYRGCTCWWAYLLSSHLVPPHYTRDTSSHRELPLWEAPSSSVWSVQGSLTPPCTWSGCLRNCLPSCRT